jgi:hypothetical protein
MIKDEVNTLDIVLDYFKNERTLSWLNIYPYLGEKINKTISLDSF